jgi:hypothetical protein
VFAIFLLLFLAGLAVVLFLVLGPLSGGLHRPFPLFLLACAVPFVFFALASLFGGLAFRRIGAPIAESWPPPMPWPAATSPSGCGRNPRRVRPAGGQLQPDDRRAGPRRAAAP